MESAKAKEKRNFIRRHLYHLTKMKTGSDIPLRDCLILDISDRGVRLYVGGLNVPDQFNLLLGEDVVSECSYEVIGDAAAKLAPSSLVLRCPRIPLKPQAHAICQGHAPAGRVLTTSDGSDLGRPLGASPCRPFPR
jgi:hypothetical protein